jgi:hypothetical protein
MTKAFHLRPVLSDELVDALSVGLGYDGRKKVIHADVMMARITADWLVKHLTISGFVVMKPAPASAPTTTAAVGRLSHERHDRPGCRPRDG